MAFLFEKLLVYQKAVSFADRICELTSGFPRGYWFLIDQLNRAALSISTNIAEGNGRFTKADRRNFFGISRGSVQECVPLLELAQRRAPGADPAGNARISQGRSRRNRADAVGTHQRAGQARGVGNKIAPLD